MTYVQKDWKDDPDHTTPLSGAAIEDLEVRLADHTERHGASVSVMDPTFGVVADGTTDDTTAFAAARTSAGVGGHVYVPAGTYALDGLNLNVASQRWECAPGAVLKLKANSAAHNIVRLNADFVELHGGEFDGNRLNQVGTDPNNDVVQIDPHTGVRVNGIYVHDGEGHGIAAYGTNPHIDCEVKGCRFLDNVTTGVIFNLGNAAGGPSRGIRIIDCWSDNSAIAAATVQGAGFNIYASGASTANKPKGCVIHGCYAKSRADAVADIGGYALTECNEAVLANCYTGGTGFGITTPTCTNLVITGCVVRGAQDYGIELVDVTGASVSGCQVDGDATTSIGIALNGGSDLMVTGCKIGGLAGTGQAIQFPGTTTRATISGNDLRSNNRCIGIGGNSDSIDLVITGNLLSADGANYGILADGLGASASKRWLIQGNTFLDFATAAVYLFAGSPFTLSDVWIRDNQFYNSGTSIGLSSITLNNTCVASDSAAIKLKSGAPTDSDFTATPADGMMALDTLNHRFYVRDGGSWKYAALT